LVLSAGTVQLGLRLGRSRLVVAIALRQAQCDLKTLGGEMDMAEVSAGVRDCVRDPPPGDRRR
jgi:hypothetical protein